MTVRLSNDNIKGPREALAVEEGRRQQVQAGGALLQGHRGVLLQEPHRPARLLPRLSGLQIQKVLIRFKSFYFVG